MGTHLDVRIRKVRFAQDTIRLAGEIVLPPGAGPHPGIVFVHGSGPATRDDYREWSYYFAANGIAALIYDKRGAGASSGDYRRATFHDLAADAAAAARLLRTRPEIDPAKVGMSGGSQGAWVAPIAAGLDSALAFLIPTGGGPVTPAVQEIYRRARIVSDSGYPASIVELSRTILTTYFDYLGSDGRDPALASRESILWTEHAGRPWFPLLDLPARDPTVGDWPEGRQRFARELHFDAAPFVRALRIPTLAILGEEDQGFPVPETVRAWREAAPRDRLTVLVIPGVDHGFWVRDNVTRPQHQSPALFEAMVSWIRRVLDRPAPSLR
jgi:dienelactone hydrolase